jgi:hypothetical protein
MVKRILRKFKKIVPRKTKSENYLVNKKYLGEEPAGSRSLSKLDYITALNWYSYMCDVADAREYLMVFLEAIESPMAEGIEHIPENWVPCTAAWIARMHMRDCDFPSENTVEYIINQVALALSKINIPKPEKVSAADRAAARLHDFLADVDGLVDDRIMNGSMDGFSMADWLNERNATAMHVALIVERLAPVLAEYAAAAEGKDKELCEGYSHLSKNTLRRRVDDMFTLIDDAETYALSLQNVVKEKAPRAPPAPKQVPIEKKLRHLKYQDADDGLNIKSIDPVKIIGARELYVFNTRYRTLTKFVAKTEAGLDVNRSSITNYSDDDSGTFTVGTRKTDTVLKQMATAGKVSRRRIFDGLKKTPKLTDRIGDNTILLDVVRT